MSASVFQPSNRFAPLTVGASPAEYHALGVSNELARGNPARVMSRSELREFAKCPRRWILGTERKETAAMEWGTLVDGIVLAGPGFRSRFAVHPMTYDSTGMQCPKCGSVTDSKSCRGCKCDRVEVKSAKEWNWNSETCAAWREANAGQAIVSSERFVRAEKAAARLAEDEVTGPFLRECQTEVQVCVDYTDPGTGLVVTLKMLLDLVPHSDGPFANALGDLKTSINAGAEAWQRHVHEHGYHYQSGMYLDGYNAASGESRYEFRHVISESVPPYEPAARFLSEEFVNLGRIEYRNDLALYCHCLKTGDFPGYTGERTSRISFQGWQMTEPTQWMIDSSMRSAPPLELPPEPVRDEQAEDLAP